MIHARKNRCLDGGLARAVAVWQANDETHTRLFVRGDATDASYFAAALDAFSFLLDVSTGADPTLLHLTDNTLRKEIGDVLDAFPSVKIAGVARGAVAELSRVALDVLDNDAGTRMAAHEELERLRIAALPELTVATDASKSRRRGVGVACVSEEGDRHQRMVPNVKSVPAGELLAIELAIDRFTDRRLRILSDSRTALQHLGVLQSDWPLRPDGEAKAVADRIRESMRGRDIRFSWVRGHSGHLLNETADRLAVAVRRAHEAQIPTEIRQAIAERIVEPVFAAA
ncbi:RNase H family protein [Rhodococcus sp. AG1013]|uniref:RNase H family protein n=1 Tax=Rhodococcus sp. AG1013 TaxID=2183996 RepID=UPI000E0C2B60|nr:RNase H family protein [Rhodococcus sp. AG1013]